MLSPLAQRFRTVVAMWILVGLGGSPLAAVFGLLALTGTGPFADKAHVSVDVEFAPDQEVERNVVRPGDFLVLAYPESVDLAAVECTTKSRVYSTGAQHVDTVLAEQPDGVAPVLRSTEPDPRRFVPVALVEWMGTDDVSCTGGGAESFALTSARGVHTDGFRYTAGAVCLLFSVVLLATGFLALHLTRTWSRQASAQQHPHWPHPQYPQYQQHPQPPQAPLPPLPPGHDPYAPPPGSEG